MQKIMVNRTVKSIAEIVNGTECVHTVIISAMKKEN